MTFRFIQHALQGVIFFVATSCAKDAAEILSHQDKSIDLVLTRSENNDALEEDDTFRFIAIDQEGSEEGTYRMHRNSDELLPCPVDYQGIMTKKNEADEFALQLNPNHYSVYAISPAYRYDHNNQRFEIPRNDEVFFTKEPFSLDVNNYQSSYDLRNISLENIFHALIKVKLHFPNEIGHASHFYSLAHAEANAFYYPQRKRLNCQFNDDTILFRDLEPVRLYATTYEDQIPEVIVNINQVTGSKKIVIPLLKFGEENLTLEPNKVYTFDINIGKDEVSINTKIENWEIHTNRDIVSGEVSSSLWNRWTIDDWENGNAQISLSPFDGDLLGETISYDIENWERGNSNDIQRIN